MKKMVLALSLLVASSATASSMIPHDMIQRVQMFMGEKQVPNSVVVCLAAYFVASQWSDAHRLVGKIPMIGETLMRHIPCHDVCEKDC